MNNKGFSLIELSIVLIIIGLLIVGSIKGYALYVSARALRLNQEMTKYAFASEQFTAKYGSYPGLLEDAVAKLGSKAKVKLDENKTNKQAINGGSNPSPTNAESVNFFNHLSLAGLLDEGEDYVGTDSNLSSLTRQADILVVAIGKPKFITKDFVKPNAVVVDVGINRIDGKLCGDVDFDNVKDICSFISPVPGGVGPLTVACLMENTFKLALNKFSF